MGQNSTVSSLYHSPSLATRQASAQVKLILAGSSQLQFILSLPGFPLPWGVENTNEYLYGSNYLDVWCDLAPLKDYIQRQTIVRGPHLSLVVVHKQMFHRQTLLPDVSQWTSVQTHDKESKHWNVISIRPRIRNSLHSRWHGGKMSPGGWFVWESDKIKIKIKEMDYNEKTEMRQNAVCRYQVKLKNKHKIARATHL